MLLNRSVAPLVRATAFVAAIAAGAAPAFARQSSEAQAAAARTSFSGNYLAGRVAGSQRDVDAAAAYFRAALREDPRNPQLLERAFLLSVAEGDGEQAMRLAERVTAADKSNRVAQLALAIRSIKTGSYAAARTHLGLGGQGPLADLTTNLLAGWAWLGSGDAEKALESVDKLRGADFFSSFREYNGALIADLAGRKEDAARRFAAALAGDGGALRIVEAAAAFRARNGDAAGAVAALDELEKTVPRHPLMRAARLAIAEGREVKRPVADIGEGVAEVLYGIGGALARQGGEDLAIVYLQLALFLEPRHPMALVTLADLYDQLNQFDDAIAAYARVPGDSPLKRNAEIQSAIDLDRLERTDEAKTQLQKLIAQDATDQEAIVALGNVERGREQFIEAAASYTKAIDLIMAAPPAKPVAGLDQDPTAAQTGAATYVVKSGESLWDIAENTLGDPRRWPELVALNRTPEAFRATGARLPRSNVVRPGQTILVPAAAAARSSAPPSAAAAAPAGPNRSHWSLFYVRGIAHERSKQWPKSEADLRKALELYPDQPLVLNYLGYSWIDQGINLDEGMKMIRRAVELRPDDGYIVDSLGWAHYRLGAYDDAVRELERAVELRPHDPVMNDHLGDAYWRVGRQLEARFQWSHAKDLNPDAEDLKKIEVKLVDGLPPEPKTNAADAQEKKGGG